jgi:hypothetical protein
MSYGAARKRGSGNELVAACCELLSWSRVFFYRNNSGAYKAPHGSFIRFGTPGSPDIVAVIHGMYVGFECKMGSGRLNENQKIFKQALEQAGGKYFEIHKPEDMQAALKNLGV